MNEAQEAAIKWQVQDLEDKLNSLKSQVYDLEIEHFHLQQQLCKHKMVTYKDGDRVCILCRKVVNT
jgi:hypothetical protein